MELIDREAFRKRLIAKYHCVPIVGLPYGDNWETLNAALEDEPVIAAAPVMHGRWEWYEERNGTPIDGYDYSWAWRCSHCKTNLPDNYDDPNDSPQIHYCSRCGAKMDGGEIHETD